MRIASCSAIDDFSPPTRRPGRDVGGWSAFPIRSEPSRSRPNIVLRPASAPGDDALAREIQDFVKVELAAYEYLRFVQFAESPPLTATGEVPRAN
jgi:acyl-CoA synthetase (AMP-forming)/AMP-acid ligase II